MRILIITLLLTTAASAQVFTNQQAFTDFFPQQTVVDFSETPFGHYRYSMLVPGSFRFNTEEVELDWMMIDSVRAKIAIWTDTLDIEFARPVSAFGIEFYNSDPRDVILLGKDGQRLGDAIKSESAFFGFSASDPVYKVRLNTQPQRGDGIYSVNYVTGVPEPSGTLLLALMSVGAVSRRRRRA